MSSERKTNKQMYELTPQVIGEIERVPRQLRKGVPDEYSILLKEAREKTVGQVDEVIRKAAKKHVPDLYAILKNAGYTPFNARQVIVADCKPMWGKAYVETYLPKETKHAGKRKGAQKMVLNKQQKIETENKHIKDIVKPFIPDITDKTINTIRKDPELKKAVGLAVASQETRERVAKAGGDAKYEQHPEQMSEMGEASADKWTKLREEARTLQVQIEKEEHEQMTKAYFESVAMRANGTGGYVLFIKDGEFDKVEASNGIPEKSANK